MKGLLCGFVIECSVADDGNHCSPSIVKLPTYHSSVLCRGLWCVVPLICRRDSLINKMIILRKLLIIGNNLWLAIVHCCVWLIGDES